MTEEESWRRSTRRLKISGVVLALSFLTLGFAGLWACTFETCRDCHADVRVNLCVLASLPFDGGFSSCPDAGSPQDSGR